MNFGLFMKQAIYIENAHTSDLQFIVNQTNPVILCHQSAMLYAFQEQREENTPPVQHCSTAISINANRNASLFKKDDSAHDQKI